MGVFLFVFFVVVAVFFLIFLIGRYLLLAYGH